MKPTHPLLMIACLALAVPAVLPAAPAASTVTVTIVESPGTPTTYSFDPPLLNIPVGTTVTWINTGTLYHTVTVKASPSGEAFNAGIEPGKSFSYTFGKAGVSLYHCIPHELPQNGNMRGAIVVA